MKKILLAFLIFTNVKLAFSQFTFPNLQVQYDSAWLCNHYQIIPIFFTDKVNKEDITLTNLLTLQQALAQKKVVIKENQFDGNQNVNSLSIKNISKQDILLLDGDLLKGGKQDRMIAETKIIKPDKETYVINVFCIEKGRWSKRAKLFSYAGFGSNTIRKIADNTKTQQAVWKEIEKQFEAKKINSVSYPYLELQKQLTIKDIACYNYFIEKSNKANTNLAGFIIAFDTTIIACEVFANTTLCNAAFSNVLQSYFQIPRDTISKALPILKNKVQAFAEKIFSSEANQKKYLTHHGTLFYIDKKPLHLIAYDN